MVSASTLEYGNGLCAAGWMMSGQDQTEAFQTGISAGTSRVNGIAQSTVGLPSYPNANPAPLTSRRNTIRAMYFRRDGKRCGFRMLLKARWDTCSTAWHAERNQY